MGNGPAVPAGAARRAQARITPARMVPLAVLGAGLAAFFLFGLDEYVSFASLRDHRDMLVRFVAEHRLAASTVFTAAYAAAIAFSLPIGAVMTIAGGFLFGNLLGTVYVVIGATLGAAAVFLIAKTSLGEPLRARFGPWLRKMEGGFQDNAFHYLLVLRLVPLFPFVVVNIVPAFLGVRLRAYVAATFLGIIPATFVFASVGAGLGDIFTAGGDFSEGDIMTPDIVVALAGLAVLALAPVAYKKLKARRRRAARGAREI